MKTGIELIDDERKRQVESEGWTPEHDDEHEDGELVFAAVAYALPRDKGENPFDEITPNPWPWDPISFKPGDGTTVGRVRELVKAGALIAAEIDRLQRSAVEWEAHAR